VHDGARRKGTLLDGIGKDVALGVYSPATSRETDRNSVYTTLIVGQNDIIKI
jgi:hypothetical protein